MLDKIANFVEYLAEIAQLRRLTERSIGALFGSLRLFESVVDGEGESATPDQVERVERTREWASAAQVAIDSDFALLNGHSLMGSWGALEAMVEDVCVLWTAHSGAIHSQAAFSRIKVTAVDFLGLSERDQIVLLLGELRRSIASDLKPGVGQFESVLDSIGLGGSVDDDVRRSLFYAQQLRNLVAHRGGVADKRFVNACAALDYDINEKVSISTDQYFHMVDAMQAYAVTLAERVRAAFGLKPTGLRLTFADGEFSFPSRGRSAFSRREAAP